MLTRSILALVAIGALILLLGNPAAQAGQSHAAFEAAIRDHSTSPWIVLITVVDDRTGEARTGCNTANFLLGAILIEKSGSVAEGIKERVDADRIATENTSHVFHFSNPKALANVLPFRYPSECAGIERGVQARVGDRGGKIYFGPFVKEPSVIWSSCPRTNPPDEKADVQEKAITREQYELSRRDLPPARVIHREGVEISLLVGPDGAVTESKIEVSSGSVRIDKATQAVLAACKFTPRTIDGEPGGPAWTKVSIENSKDWPFSKPAKQTECARH